MLKKLDLTLYLVLLWMLTHRWVLKCYKLLLGVG